jgi:hypothetical protein
MAFILTITRAAKLAIQLRIAGRYMVSARRRAAAPGAESSKPLNSLARASALLWVSSMVMLTR